MRMRSSVAGPVLAAAFLISCGPGGGSGLARGPARPGPVMLGHVPACTYRVLARMEGRIDHLSPQTIRGRDSHPVVSQARSLGADAVIGFTSFPEFDNNRRQVATNWNALAIDFSDPDNPDCYR